MRSGPTAAAAALLSLALILPACGDEGTATAGPGTEQRETPAGPGAAPGAAMAGGRIEPGAGSAAKRCGHRLGDFLDAMESLGNSVAVGLDYEGYLSAVSHVRAAYAAVDADRLQIPCLARVAGPAEGALNAYIGAANAWGDCLATPSCDPESVEPELQRKWEGASALLGEARSALRQLS